MLFRIVLFLQEKEYELSHVFNNGRESVQDVLSMSDVNKYSYEHKEQRDQSVAPSNVVKKEIVEFVPAKTPRKPPPPVTEAVRAEKSYPELKTNKKTSKNDRKQQNEVISNEIPTLPSSYKSYKSNGQSVSRKIGPASSIKSFRSGYHASSSPNDFFKKKYKSHFLQVRIFMSFFDVKIINFVIQASQEKVFPKKSSLNYHTLMNSYSSKGSLGSSLKTSESASKKLRRRRLRRLRHRRKGKSRKSAQIITKTVLLIIDS